MLTVTLLAALAALPVPVQVAHVPPACARAPGLCAADVRLEWSLEVEYWQLLGNIGGFRVADGVPRDIPPDMQPMRSWLSKAKRYRHAAPIPPIRAAHLDKLISAGELVLFRYGDLDWALIDLERCILRPTDLQQFAGAYHVAQAARVGDRAYKLDPTDSNIQVFHHALAGFLAFALPTVFGDAEASLRAMLGPHPERCQDAASCRAAGTSTEGIMAAAMLLSLHRDPAQVRRALRLLGDTPQSVADCTHYACAHTTSLAPGKRLGGLMVIAEAYAKVGELAKMNQALDLLEATARQQAFPLISAIAELRQKLQDDQGLRAEWASGWRVGAMALPLPPSTSLRTCQTCHLGGTPAD